MGKRGNGRNGRGDDEKKPDKKKTGKQVAGETENIGKSKTSDGDTADSSTWLRFWRPVPLPFCILPFSDSRYSKEGKRDGSFCSNMWSQIAWLGGKMESLGEVSSMGLTKFGQPQGSMGFSGDGKRYRKRVDLAEKCLEHIAGSLEGAALMAKHLAGFANRTTDSVLEKFNTRPPKECATTEVQNLYVGEIA